MLSSYKKIFLLGFIITILLAIPFSVYIAQKRQNTTTKAAAATVLALEPAVNPIKVGDTLTLNITLDPNSANQVSFVKLSISYDASKFATFSGSLSPNPAASNAMKIVIDDAKYDSGKATISLSIGSDPTKAITTKTTIATLQLKATDVVTPSGPNFTFDAAPATQVLSIASTDQTSENVLSSTNPATVTVTGTAAPSSTPTLTPTVTPTKVPGTTGTVAPTLPPSSAAPVCTSLTTDVATNGFTPYTISFTATGSDTDGTISKISFNFGDTAQDLTTGGGIGTSSVSAQMMHVYVTPGIYTAYALLTDSTNDVSAQQTNCTQTITIAASQSAEITSTPVPTGDNKAIFSFGALGIIITIIGGALLLL